MSSLLVALLFVALAASQAVAQRTPLAGRASPASDAAPVVRSIRIDPLTLVSVREYRNVLAAIGDRIFPGWKTTDIPILLYRPGVQDVLIGAPRRPRGFGDVVAATPLEGERLYGRNDSTVMDLDDQNTIITLDSMRVLVVADRYSRARNQLRGTMSRPADEVGRWLDGWNFVPSPYDEVQLLLHEAFHVHQSRRAPDKSADEGAVARYPLLDPRNNALFALEGRILRDALLTDDRRTRREKAAQFVAVRRSRRAALDSASVAYENLNEFSEGLGRYVEMRFLQLGDLVRPTPEMYLQAGFEGYRGVLRRRFVERLDDMVRIAANSDNRFGNRFGSGPLRFRTYDLGAAQGLLLDDVAPTWKTRIFENGVYLSDLLAAALPLSPDAERRLVADAQSEYGFDSLLANRTAFEAEGRRRIAARVDSIMNTAQTLVVIDYGGVGEKLGIGYTPFGVTAVNEQAAIYDLVPIAIRFANRALLQMKSVVPVLIDRQARTVSFAITTAPGAVAAADTIATDAFTIEGASAAQVTVTDRRVRITLR